MELSYYETETFPLDLFSFFFDQRNYRQTRTEWSVVTVLVLLVPGTSTVVLPS